MSESSADVRTFLIADVRGYTRFTEEYGDEVAARLAAKFVEVVQDSVEGRGGTVVEIRGDEALAVFTSPRQAIRAAVDLQARFDEETEAGCPASVNICCKRLVSPGMNTEMVSSAPACRRFWKRSTLVYPMHSSLFLIPLVSCL